MSRRTGLGKGLDALIPHSALENTAGEATQLLIDQISRNPHQPRTDVNGGEIENLAASIREHGILQPLIVRHGQGENQYTLVAGERRLTAARLAGLESVPVLIRQVSDEEQLELALIENLQRTDLSPLETAAAYHQLGDMFGLSHEEIARKVGKSRTSITNNLRLLNLIPKAQHALAEGKITEGHARALLGLPNPQAQQAALETILVREMNVRQTEELVRKMSGVRTIRLSKTSQSPEVRDIEDRLRVRLGTKVSVHHGAKGGRMVIYYYSDEELQNLVSEILED